MYLESIRLKLRAVEPEDLDILYKWENDTSLWRHGNTLTPYSKFTLRQYINDTRELDIYQSKQLRLMIEEKESGHTAGTIDLYDFDVRNLRAGIGILIGEEYREKGYASETLKMVKDYAFNFFHLQQLYAYISTDNKPSISLFEKVGFTASGRLKNWLCLEAGYQDVFIYQIMKPENE